MTDAQLATRQAPLQPPADPWRPLETLQDELERVFGRYLPSRWVEGRLPTTLMPWSTAMDVVETRDAIEVSMDVPGLAEKDIEVTLAEGILTVRGERKAEHDRKERDYHLVERSFGAFQRRVRLQCDIDQDGVSAKVEKGVLRVHLPKSAKARSSSVRIPVAAG